MNRIAFTLPDNGLREIEGLVWIEDGFLMIEVKNKLLGLIDEDTNLIKIEPGALGDVYIKRRPFKDRMVLVPRKRELLDAMPGKHVNEVSLKIWNRRRSQVLEMVAELRAMKKLAQSAKKLDPENGQHPA